MSVHELFKQQIEELAQILGLDIIHFEMEVIQYPTEHELIERIVVEIDLSRKVK